MSDGTSVTHTSFLYEWLGHGSMSTIDKYTKVWQNENHNKPNTQATDQATDLPEAFADAAQMMFKIALDEARRQVKKEFDQRHSAFEMERERLGTELLDALDKVSEAEKSVASHLEARKRYKDLLENEQVRSRELEEKLVKSERALAAVTQQRDQQKKDLAKQKPDREALQPTSAEALEVEKGRYEALVDQLNQRLEQEEAHGRDLQGRADQVVSDLMTTKETLKSKAEQLLESDRALAEVRSQIAGMELTLVELSRNLEQMTEKCDEQTALVNQLNQEREALAGDLKARDDEVDQLRSDRDQHEQRANQALADLSEIVRAGLRKKVEKQEE